MPPTLTVNIWTDPDASCPCVADHNPNPVSFDRHHILPLAWGGDDSDDNIVLLCPTAHRNVHDLLRFYAAKRGTPPWEVRQRYGKPIRTLAQRGWDRWLELTADEPYLSTPPPVD